MNLPFTKSIIDNVQQRFSCRTYSKQIISDNVQEKLSAIISSLHVGPLGSHCRFKLVAATDEDNKSLQGLGTYGFIRGATGFVIGATEEGGKSLEDFGYLMEQIILLATDLGLGTCWLGGFFARSRFAKKISTSKDEIIPAVTSIGYIAARPRKLDQFIRSEARSDHRHPWEWLFFNRQFGDVLDETSAGDYAKALEMVRLGPSASNLQPWRIIKCDKMWHFYLRRRLGYRESGAAKLLKTADLQRVDMGIAMCHFALTAWELGLTGKWDVCDPGIPTPDPLTEYTVSWVN